MKRWRVTFMDGTFEDVTAEEYRINNGALEFVYSSNERGAYRIVVVIAFSLANVKSWKSA